MRRRLLIISFSDIRGDARVVKQVHAFAETYDVVTCGFGDAPRPDVEHVRVRPPDANGGIRSRLRPYGNAILMRLHWYRVMYWRDPLVRQAIRLLRGRRFDAVIANDIDTVPLAVHLFGSRRVHADLHEYFPGLHDDSAAWTRWRKPYFEWLVLRYATRAASATTVGEGVAETYLAHYGLRCAVATNASPEQALDAKPVGKTIRLVHSGVAQPGRQLEITMNAVARSSNSVSLDLYLMPSDEEYLRQLKELAARLGSRLTVRAPVEQAGLVRALSAYDLGVFVLPPTSTNNEHALPNKFFDFVQARLGILIGPSSEMVRILNKYELGAVTPDFTEDSLLAVLDSLDAKTVATWKRNADRASHALSAGPQTRVWIAAVAALPSGEQGRNPHAVSAR